MAKVSSIATQDDADGLPWRTPDLAHRAADGARLVGMIAQVAEHPQDERVAAHRGWQSLGHRPDLGSSLEGFGAQLRDLLVGQLDAAAELGVLGDEVVDVGGSHCAKIGRG